MTVDADVTVEEVPEINSAAATATVKASPLFERTAPLFAAFLLIALGCLAVALMTVHHREPGELAKRPGSLRSHIVLSTWLSNGYFHSFGLITRDSDRKAIYLNSTGGYMVSGFIAEKVYSTIAGQYSYRLLALHNQFISMVISALGGLLCYRLVRRMDLDPRLAFGAGTSVVVILFTFPDNLDLFWEMSAQAYALLFALLYLVIEERGIDLPIRPRALVLGQAATVFLMTVMEGIVALAFVASVAATIAFFRRNEPWKRFLLTVALPCVVALLLYQTQLLIAKARLPDLPTTGSNAFWRTGLDGESRYYGDHLGIATRRDVARGNWPSNREYLFNWKWVFILGVAAVLYVLIAFLRGLAPRIALESLVALTGAWLLYAAVFSQAVVIHPYLYDVLLFTPLCIALFGLAPSLLESMTRRTGAIILVLVLSAVWYSFFQMRLYSLRWPLPSPAPTASPATTG